MCVFSFSFIEKTKFCFLLFMIWLLTNDPIFFVCLMKIKTAQQPRAYNLASVFNNGTSFCVSIMFPVIFNLPFMNATCGLILPNAMSTKSESVTDNVVSGLTPSAGLPSYTVPFFKSSAVHTRTQRSHATHRHNEKSSTATTRRQECTKIRGLIKWNESSQKLMNIQSNCCKTYWHSWITARSQCVNINSSRRTQKKKLWIFLDFTHSIVLLVHHCWWYL